MSIVIIFIPDILAVIRFFFNSCLVFSVSLFTMFSMALSKLTNFKLDVDVEIFPLSDSMSTFANQCKWNEIKHQWQL